MAKAFNDVDEPIGTECNQGGLRRYQFEVRDGDPYESKETLSDLVLEGYIPQNLDFRTKQDLISLVEDIASYVSTLKREYRIVVVGRDSRKLLTTGNTCTDTRMKQDFAVLTSGVEAKRRQGETINNDFARRLRAVEEKLGL